MLPILSPETRNRSWSNTICRIRRKKSGALAGPEILARWLMPATSAGGPFPPRGASAGWDGIVHCEVLVVEHIGGRYSWRGGSDKLKGWRTARRWRLDAEPSASGSICASITTASR
jgi:hypothetical protein